MPELHEQFERRLGMVEGDVAELKAWRRDVSTHITNSLTQTKEALTQNAKDNAIIIQKVTGLDYSINSQDEANPGLRMVVRGLKGVEKIQLWAYRTIGGAVIAAAATSAFAWVRYAMQHTK